MTSEARRNLQGLIKSLSDEAPRELLAAYQLPVLSDASLATVISVNPAVLTGSLTKVDVPIIVRFLADNTVRDSDTAIGSLIMALARQAAADYLLFEVRAYREKRSATRAG